jgi:hypothetical protein
MQYAKNMSEKYTNIRLFKFPLQAINVNKLATFNPEFSNNHIQDALRQGGGGNFPQ